MLICHLTEGHLVVVRRALLDVHLQDLALLLCGEGLAIAPAGAARRLHLLYHGPHADDLHLDAAATAIAALLHALLLVNDLASDGHLLRGAFVDLLEGYLEGLHDVLGLLAPSSSAASAAASAAEHGLEDVPGVARPVVVEALLAEAVVLGALVRVAQDLVRARDLLELLRVSALVGVVLHGQLAVRLLDLRVCRVLVDLQTLVELRRVRRLAAAAAALSAHARKAAIHAGKAAHAWAAEEHGGGGGGRGHCRWTRDLLG
mmetsp:Transcript_52935/g.136740  ORF Transcript_52935/g.136740 Transcript_52935/m.136740 type:complete len:260 (-) Transcript_52935:46-825(-)